MESMPIWEASSTRKKCSHMFRFLEKVNATQDPPFADWWALYAWSLQEPCEFWAQLAQFCEIRWHHPPRFSLQMKTPASMRCAQWFPEGTLNFAENLLVGLSSGNVLSEWREDGSSTTWTGVELRSRVAQWCKGLQAAGVLKGDVVAGVLPNGAEAIIAMLATTALGAVWSSCSPDFGPAGILDRLSQVRPKVCFYTDAYVYNGKTHACEAGIQACRQAMPETQWFSVGGDTTSWGQWTRSWATSTEIPFVYSEFSHPVYILFSSGTTGRPKCIVHGAGGTLLQHKKELMLHSDIGRGDILLFYTTCGWMMWNWMVSALSVGAHILTYDGSVAFPDLSVLWNLVERARITVLGTSPKFLATNMAANIHPSKIADLSSLRTVLSTGAPLLVEHYHWLYREVKTDMHVASISGGTDILSCFMLGNPLLPVYPGEIQAPGLGMAVSARREDFTEVVGEKGELVCTSPFVSMPVGFWQDPEQVAYQQTYFSFFPGREVWRHGDYIEVTPRGGIIVHGRSDATLNPGGVRIGTAEIYRQVESVSGVQDSLAVGYSVGGEEKVLLFVQRISESPSQKEEELKTQIRSLIRGALSPRHVPYRIFVVQQIPYTRNGKKMELVVKAILHAKPIPNPDSIANPESLAEYAAIHLELQQEGRQNFVKHPY
jgi:acetoacetyl-CoA synthetase